MNVKRIFGVILSVLGIGGLIYTAMIFVNTGQNNTRNIKELIIYGVLGLLFFIAGIGLIRTTKDEADPS